MTAGVRAVALGLAVIVAAPVSAANHHHHGTTSHHAKATRKTSSKPSRSSRHEKPAHPDAAVARGVLSVPAGGIKLFCGPGRNPLLIRKMTQGNGTTVTVVCR